jgi:hypothetical protein
MDQRGHADGEERARVMGAYVLANPGQGELKMMAFYKENVAAWFEAKETSMRAAGASDAEIVEYLKSANASMNAILDDASPFVINRGGNRHERRRAQRSQRGRSSRAGAADSLG